MTTQELFKQFLKKTIIVFYNNRTKTMKGLLDLIDNDKGFLLIKGDYTTKIINFKDINEVKEVRKNDV